ncbi:unnamed protein product, partial [marine sediment metagenome]
IWLIVTYDTLLRISQDPDTEAPRFVNFISTLDISD